MERLRGLLSREHHGRDGQLAGPVSDGTEVSEDVVRRLVGIACQHEEVVAPSGGAEERALLAREILVERLGVKVSDHRQGALLPVEVDRHRLPATHPADGGEDGAVGKPATGEEEIVRIEERLALQIGEGDHVIKVVGAHLSVGRIEVADGEVRRVVGRADSIRPLLVGEL